MDPKKLTRKQAAKLIEDVQIAAARGELSAVRYALEHAGLTEPERCDGEAHANAFIDNCSSCAPHWGYVVQPIKIA